MEIQLYFTTKTVRERKRQMFGAFVFMKRIPKELFFGVTYLPYGEYYVPVSDVEKTFIDMVYFAQPIGKELLKEFKKRINAKKMKEYLLRVALYENMVCSELIKLGFEPKYWRTKAKAEVDFVVERENKPVPLEVKSSEEGLSRSYHSFLDAYSPKQGFFLSLRGVGKKKVKKTEVSSLPLAGSFLVKKKMNWRG